MAKSDSSTQVPCPKCSVQQTVEPVSTIRREDSITLEKLFRGQLNKVHCSECGAVFVLEIPILFRDDAARSLIYYMPVPDRKAWEEAEKQMQQMADVVFGEETDMAVPECRLTVSRPQFIEKIAIHVHGLNDRLIEYIKYQLFRQKEGSVDSIRHELLYDFSGSGQDKLAFVIFDRETSKAVAATHLPTEVYEELEETFGTSLSMKEELKELFPGYYVNVERLL